MSEEQFWIVWCPSGERPPSYRHQFQDMATREAERLAAENPGRLFYVLRAESVSSRPPEVLTLPLVPRLPF